MRFPEKSMPWQSLGSSDQHRPHPPPPPPTPDAITAANIYTIESDNGRKKKSTNIAQGLGHSGTHLLPCVFAPVIVPFLNQYNVKVKLLFSRIVFEDGQEKKVVLSAEAAIKRDGTQGRALLAQTN